MEHRPRSAAVNRAEGLSLRAATRRMVAMTATTAEEKRRERRAELRYRVERIERIARDGGVSVATATRIASGTRVAQVPPLPLPPKPC